jgi:hypothetical protein
LATKFDGFIFSTKKRIFPPLNAPFHTAVIECVEAVFCVVLSKNLAKKLNYRKLAKN